MGRRWHRFSATTPSLVCFCGLLLLLVLPTGDAWWMPGPGVNWQWQLQGELELSLDVDMYDLDLFDVSAEDIATLRDRDVVVICSFSAGTFEEERSDAVDFPASALGNGVGDGGEGERWLNITDEGILSIMEGRLDLAVNKSCDGVEPSNVQVYLEDSGMNFTSSDQLVYNTWLAAQAHDRNLSVGLLNDWPQLEDLEPFFDWALSEECLLKGECEAYHSNFVAAGKAVLDAEYFQLDLAFCDNVTASGLDVIIKDPSLDARRCSCQNPSTHIECDDLLSQIPTVTSGASSSWVIATAVGGSIFIIVVAAIVSVWRRKKSGGSGAAEAGVLNGGDEGRSSLSNHHHHSPDFAVQ